MKFLKNKILMVTGGTGSFGSTIIKNLLNSKLKEIRIFSRDEKSKRICVLFNNSKLKFYIGDVRTFESVNQAMKGVDYVFSSFKTSTFMRILMEAVRTNVLGTENVLNLLY